MPRRPSGVQRAALVKGMELKARARVAIKECMLGGVVVD